MLNTQLVAISHTGVDLKKSFDKLMITREAGDIKRYHTARIPAQSVSAHTYGVMNLVLMLSEEPPSLELVKAVMWHDIAEIATGDVPAPAKYKDRQLMYHLERLENDFLRFNNLDTWISSQEIILLKWADTLELVLYCAEQCAMGNSYALVVLRNGVEICGKLPRHNSARIFLELIQQHFSKLGVTV